MVNINFSKLKKPFVIAEVGINHGGSLKKAFKLIDAAKSSGANAVKFQTYITEKRVWPYARRRNSCNIDW